MQQAKEERELQAHLHDMQTDRRVTAQMKVHSQSYLRFASEACHCGDEAKAVTVEGSGVPSRVAVPADERPSELGGAIPDNKAASFARAFAKIMESAGPGRGLLQVGRHVNTVRCAALHLGPTALVSSQL